ncbi:hypothetical protein ILUMI_08273 [Ignelater luminosus]|uniref:C2H2-type domain-containing protein n=1 Tax=Ignelater luminosus TaxID=2038154 RepID=A0A8K0D768_IGNLU|nr:hypothetical protein ILUMI_08273 [Ignelater luminosus]
MSDQYPFIENDNYKSENVLDTTVLVEDGVVWDQEEVQISLNYSNDEEETLTEQNDDNYLTANETGNDTHYFSVLENTTEANLNDLSEIAIAYNEADNSEIGEDQPTVRSICTIGGQPEIYRIEGSDDLYAFEITCDQEGNVQKLRYKLRLNENGEYESVMDSIEVVPFESELEGLPSQEEHLEDENSLGNVRVVVKQEMPQEQLEQETILPDIPQTAEESGDELHVNEEEEELSHESLNTIEETKAGILDQNLLPIHKMETLEETHAALDGTLIENEMSHEMLSATSNELVPCTHNGDISSSISSMAEDTENLTQFCAISNQNSSHDNEDIEEVHKQPSYEQILMVESHACEEEDHNEISQSNIKHAAQQFISELDENSHDTMQSAHSEESEEHNMHNAEYFEDPNETESDTDDYHIVEGVHVTADTETHEETSHVIETFLQKESAVQPQILKIQQQIPVLQSTIQEDKLKEMVNNNFHKANKAFTYYVVKHPEKENVATITEHSVTNKLIKANPRSVLKSSYLFYEQKKEKEKPIVQKIEKKVLKNKEAMQARVFHNFIAKTTIVHAPVRQQRLPRKQTIKPVERADEEIIVQEVVVSSNGFIETSEDGVVKSKVPLKPTEIVQLSDSDDDYDPKREHKKKKKYKRRKSKIPEIIISDSEEEEEEEDTSDENVVHIDLSADSEEDNEKDKNQQTEEEELPGTRKLRRSLRKSSVAEQDFTPNSSQNASTESSEVSTKKKRGRPPKRRNSNSNNDNSITSTTDTSSSSSKKQRRNTKDSLESNESNENKSEELPPTAADSEIQDIKTKWKCSKCPKTFPSQGSLKSHMQYHTFHEPSSRAVRQTVNKQEGNTFKKPETAAPKIKYECSRCGETFKNNILLSRHLKAHETSSKSLECSICKKIFADRAQLINHKRTHVKEQMFKTTTLPKHSPPKNTKKSPKKSGQFKCDYCTKIFTSLSLMNSHVRTHKQYTCSTCSSNFISKLALEEHIRLKCVKQSKPKSPVQRLSLKTRKTFLAPPSRISKRISLRRSAGKSKPPTSKSASSSSDKEKKDVSASLPCDSCPMKFTTHKALFSHKVVKHGLKTPDKSITVASSKRKALHKESGIHSSVPAGERLRSAYANVRTKLDM